MRFVLGFGLLIGGIALIANDNGLVGFLTIVFGPIAAWVSSWLLYGFGQLVENSDIILIDSKLDKVYENRSRYQNISLTRDLSFLIFH